MNDCYRRVLLPLLCIMTFCISTAVELEAQEAGEIRGIVTDAGDSSPIIGASVLLPDLKLGATTNVRGEFVIRKVPVGTYNILARYVGYKPQTKQVTVVAGGVTEVVFSLVQSTVQADEVIVTGQGTATSKRQLPTDVVTLSSKEIERTTAQSIDQLLQGQIPGLSSSMRKGYRALVLAFKHEASKVPSRTLHRSSTSMAFASIMVITFVLLMALVVLSHLHWPILLLEISSV